MFKVEMDGGFDDFFERLKDLTDRKEIELEKLFNPAFMKRHTPFATLDEMFAVGGFNVESEKDFEAIPDADLDAFVAARTGFESWQDMLEIATAEWAERKLGL